MEPRPHLERADHRRRGPGVERSRELLRPGRRAARHGAEPPHAAPHADRHGGPVALDAERDPRREDQSAASLVPRIRRMMSSLGSTPPADRTGSRSRVSETSRTSRPTPTTETFVAVRLELNNWRWYGVPFYLRTGKRLAQAHEPIVVDFNCPPSRIFGPPFVAQHLLQSSHHHHPARRGLRPRFQVKAPGQEFRSSPRVPSVPICRGLRQPLRKPTRPSCST